MPDGDAIREVAAVVDALPPAATLALAGAVVCGVVLWLLGGKLVRATIVIAGLVLGGAAGLLLAKLLQDEGSFALPMALGGALIGSIAAAVLFRLWMAISLAAVLSLAIPAAILVWQGTPPPEEADPALVRQDVRGLVEAGRGLETAAGDEGDTGESKPSVADRVGKGVEGAADRVATGVWAAAARVRAALGELYDRRADDAGRWWNDLDDALRSVALTGALGGGVAGLLLGLLLPKLGAMFETALAGSLLMLLPGVRLIEAHGPSAAWVEGVLPDSARATLVWLGLITLVGLAVQWSLFRERAEE